VKKRQLLCGGDDDDDDDSNGDAIVRPVCVCLSKKAHEAIWWFRCGGIPAWRQCISQQAAFFWTRFIFIRHNAAMTFCNRVVLPILVVTTTDKPTIIVVCITR
jgi:hypothetical protein